MSDIVLNEQKNPLSPQMPTAPTAEALAMKFEAPVGEIGSEGDGTIISSDKIANLEVVPAEVAETVVKSDKEVTPATSSKAEPKKEEMVKTDKPPILKPPVDEKKKSEVVAKDEVKKEEVKLSALGKPITPVKDKVADVADTFDYTKYSPQEVTNLKNMSRQSREYAAKLIDENKQLGSLKDATYLQHEQAYTLNPEFQQLQNQTIKAQTEGQAWEKALIDIGEGKKFRQPIGRDQKTGELIMSEELPPTRADEIRINQNLTACINALQTSQGALQQYPNRFKQTMQQDMNFINEVQKEKFAWVADPKLLDYSISVEGKGEQKLSTVIQEFKSLFPAYLQNQVGVSVAANLMVSLMIQGEELKQARNGEQVATIKSKEASRGEPSSDNVMTEKSKFTAKGVPSVFSAEGSPLNRE